MINTLIVSESKLSDLRIERLKPPDEQAVHPDGRPCGRFRLAIGERVALPPELMNDSVAPSIELGQFIYDADNLPTLNPTQNLCPSQHIL